jgi:glutamate synthase (NADPH/NADH) small chain
MGKDTGFMEFERKNNDYRPKEQRLKDYDAVAIPMEDKDLIEQSARCMNCGIPFCHGMGCPIGNVIPEFNDHVYHNRWHDALNILLQTNPFPEFTGRICPAPCEASCVLGINEEPVNIREIELAIIEKGFESGWMTPVLPAERYKERIAVVGSGPAGLATAHTLNRAGYNVTVFEHSKQLCGLLRYGIPNFKLEKWVVDRRIKLMEDEGVRFESGVEVGNDISRRYLQDRYNIVVLSGGAQEPRDLKVPGRELDGIHFAMDFLSQQNMRLSGESIDLRQEIIATDKNVVVIGGGDTGSDCLGTSLRQGARNVYQFEIMPEPPAQRASSTPWPMWPIMRRDSSSHKEGGDRRWCITTDSFSGNGGFVKELNCAEVEWVTPEKGGRPSPVKIEGSEFTVKADLVLLAMGFVGPGRNRLVAEMALELNERGNIKCDENHMTSRAGVFVAGDMTAGASLVVRAIADGQDTAKSIVEYLSK